MPGEKTEQPTPRKREEARKKGQVAVSKEMDSAMGLLAAFLAFRFAGPRLWVGMQDLMTGAFVSLDQDPVNTPLTADLGVDLIWQALQLLLPLVLVVTAFGVLGGVAQTGGIFAMQGLKPQPKRMNPLKGAKRMVASKQAAMQLVKSLLKFGVIGGVAWWTLASRWAEIKVLGLGIPVNTSLSLIADIGFDLVLRVLAVLIVIGVVDLIFQRRDLQSQLRMSLQDIKDEMRQSEGDPAVKAQVARARRSFLARVMQEVPKADVVLTNPTHYAVAIKYDPIAAAAPIVLAKGQDLVAQRIREVAIENGIPVIQNPPLTRAIHRAVPIGQAIPPDLYEAVAEVLAFVYRLRYPQARSVA